MASSRKDVFSQHNLPQTGAIQMLTKSKEGVSLAGFELALVELKKRVGLALMKADPARYERVFGKDPSHCEASLEAIFEDGVIPDQGDCRPIDSLIKSLRDNDDLKRWAQKGGSPLIASKHESFPSYGWPPILGYRETLLDGPKGGTFLRALAEMNISLEQWLLGTDQEMVAASLLRGLCTGSIKSHHLGDSIPVVLFDVFRQPDIERQIADLLKVMTLEKGESIYECTERVTMTAYVFDRVGLSHLSSVVLQSPAMTDFIELDRKVAKEYQQNSTVPERIYQPVQGLAEDLLWSTLCETDHSSMDLAYAFLEKALGMTKLSASIDKALRGPFRSSAITTNRQFVYEHATRRMEHLIACGSLPQAVFWVKEALPYMERFPVIPETQKADLMAILSVGEHRSVMGDLNVENSQALPFLIESLGRQGFIKAFRATCECAVADKDLHPEAQKIFSSDLIGLNIKQLQENGLLHAVLDELIKVYPELWADEVVKINDETYANFAVTNQMKMLTKWVGDALTALPSDRRAVAWYKCFEHPIPQNHFIATIPHIEAVFRLMNNKQRGDKFTNDLGL